MTPAYQNPDSAPVHTFARATLVFKMNMGYGYTTVQARDVEIRTGRYAQYESAVFVSFTPKGARAKRTLVGTYQPSLIVLAGWEPLAMPDTHGPAEDVGTGVSVQRGRALSCDPMWAREARSAALASGRLLVDTHEMQCRAQPS